MNDLDDPARIEDLRRLIQNKAGLRHYYLEAYGRYSQCLQRCPGEGIALELGSGGGFVKEVIPEIMTSDTLPYSGVARSSKLGRSGTPAGKRSDKPMAGTRSTSSRRAVAQSLATCHRCRHSASRLPLSDCNRADIRCRLDFRANAHSRMRVGGD